MIFPFALLACECPNSSPGSLAYVSVTAEVIALKCFSLLCNVMCVCSMTIEGKGIYMIYSFTFHTTGTSEIGCFSWWSVELIATTHI